eukprot:8896835-Pyramimonas_sp.AAC.1
MQWARNVGVVDGNAEDVERRMQAGSRRGSMLYCIRGPSSSQRLGAARKNCSSDALETRWNCVGTRWNLTHVRALFGDLGGIRRMIFGPSPAGRASRHVLLRREEAEGGLEPVRWGHIRPGLRRGDVEP